MSLEQMVNLILLRRLNRRQAIFPEPGDTIVIPRNLEKINTIPLISVATKIISDVAFAAASLNTISQ